MKVGDYVRTKDGTICKIIEDKGNRICTDYFDNVFFYEDIFKSSPNIIDLIEVGDYVNGLKVEKIEDNVLIMFGLLMRLGQDDIKSIVAKEVFESVEYKI